MLIYGKRLLGRPSSEVRNPATNEVIATTPVGNARDVDGAVEYALDGLAVKRRRSRAERAAILARTAEIVGDRCEEFASTIADECGKTIRQARKEVAARTADLRMGDPTDASTDIGPMIDEAAARRIETAVEKAVSHGARLLAGHRRTGAFYAPTALSDAPKDAAARRDEAFAPVAILDPFDSLDEAIREANRSDYLAHAGVFSNDLRRIHAVLDGGEAGGVMVTDSSDDRLDAMPFGGAKQGSMGREGVRFALAEMTQTKVVCFNAPDPAGRTTSRKL